MNVFFKIMTAALFLCVAASSQSWAQLAFCPSGSPHASLVSGTAYTLGPLDYCNTVTLTSGSAVTVALPAPGTAGELQIGWWTKVFVEGSGSATITPAKAPTGGGTPLINGASSLALATTKSATIYVGTDGNYYATFSGG